MPPRLSSIEYPAVSVRIYCETKISLLAVNDCSFTRIYDLPCFTVSEVSLNSFLISEECDNTGLFNSLSYALSISVNIRVLNTDL